MREVKAPKTRLLTLIAKSSKHENAKQPHWAQARSSCWGTRSNSHLIQVILHTPCRITFATNKSLTVQRLWYFAAGRGGQEKTFAELRSQFALDVVPTKSYAANSAWQQLNVLAHNLCRSFQLDTIAETKGISRKRTCTHNYGKFYQAMEMHYPAVRALRRYIEKDQSSQWGRGSCLRLC